MDDDVEKCKKCRCWRDKQSFVKNDKIMKTCIICRDNSQKWVEKNTNKVKEYNQQYQNKNKNKIKEQRQTYRSENVDKIKVDNQKYHNIQKIENPLKVKLQHIICSAVQSDKKPNRIYNEEDFITYEFLMSLWETQQGKCFYDNCNCEMTLDFNKSCKTPTQISIQRLDNEIAHIKSNCVLSCYFCNCVKHMEKYN